MTSQAKVVVAQMGWGVTLWWLFVRTCAALLGASGWIISVTGAAYVALGIFCIRWAGNFRSFADDIRFGLR